MTNSEIKVKSAVEAQQKGLLTSYESDFVDVVKKMTKKRT